MPFDDSLKSLLQKSAAAEYGKKGGANKKGKKYSPLAKWMDSFVSGIALKRLRKLTPKKVLDEIKVCGEMDDGEEDSTLSIVSGKNDEEEIQIEHSKGVTIYTLGTFSKEFNLAKNNRLKKTE